MELIRPVTREEVKKALWSINSTKSPGPDGYGSDFIKATWTITGGDISAAVMEFFETGKLLKQLNSTVLALIPKTENACNAGQYRPIACCNVL